MVRACLSIAAVLLLAGCGPSARPPTVVDPVVANRPVRPDPTPLQALAFKPPTNSPLVRVHRATGGAIGAGDIVPLTISYRRLPAGAGVVLSLMRDAPVDQSHWYLGPRGGVASKRNLAGSGRFEVDWDSRQMNCSGSEVWMPCPVAPGRYRSVARAYEAPGYPPSWPDTEPRPKMLGESYSEAFVVTGQPDLQALAGPLRWAALEHLRSLPLSRDYWSDGRRLGLLNPDGPVRAGAGGFCQRFVAAAPLMGALTACAPHGASSEVGLRVMREEARVTGRLGWTRGVIPVDEAKAAARRVAGIENDDGRVRETYYRPDLGAWLILVTPRLGGTELLVRVDADGRACEAARSVHGQRNRIDMEHDMVTCA